MTFFHNKFKKLVPVHEFKMNTMSVQLKLTALKGDGSDVRQCFAPGNPRKTPPRADGTSRVTYRKKGPFVEGQLEPISKTRLGFRARREAVKKRSIHVVCEYFEPFRNAAMGT